MYVCVFFIYLLILHSLVKFLSNSLLLEINNAVFSNGLMRIKEEEEEEEEVTVVEVVTEEMEIL